MRYAISEAFIQCHAQIHAQPDDITSAHGMIGQEVCQRGGILHAGQDIPTGIAQSVGNQNVLITEDIEFTA